MGDLQPIFIHNLISQSTLTAHPSIKGSTKCSIFIQKSIFLNSARFHECGWMKWGCIHTTKLISCNESTQEGINGLTSSKILIDCHKSLHGTSRINSHKTLIISIQVLLLGIK